MAASSLRIRASGTRGCSIEFRFGRVPALRADLVAELVEVPLGESVGIEVDPRERELAPLGILWERNLIVERDRGCIRAVLVIAGVGDRRWDAPVAEQARSEHLRRLRVVEGESVLVS